MKYIAILIFVLYTAGGTVSCDEDNPPSCDECVEDSRECTNVCLEGREQCDGDPVCRDCVGECVADKMDCLDECED